MTAPLRHPLTSAVTDWRDDPRAVAIFASIRRNPPRLVWRTATYVITRDEWAEYTGQRVDRLEGIYGEHWTRHRDTAMAAEDWSDFDAFTAYPTVQQAIAEALNPVDPIEPTPAFDMMMGGVIDAMRPQWSRAL